MKLCALCKNEEATKTNTHYLTDGIIRSALNVDGKSKSSDREQGLYFEMDSAKLGIKPNFQQSTPVKKLDEVYGREVTDVEIKEAEKNTPFSVDRVFCPKCEAIFTIIENRFIAEILPKFRNADLSNKVIVEINENRLFRLFFLLQIYRSSVCDEDFTLPNEITDELREIILNNEAKSDDNIKKYPLSVTYLETLADENAKDKEIERQKEFTANKVGFVEGENPYIILMNDFCIQLYEDDKINFYPFFGLNKVDDYEDYINQNEDSFKVKVLHNNERRAVYESMIKDSGIATSTVNDIFNQFIECHILYFEKMPDEDIINKFKEEFTERKFTADMYTKENIEFFIHDFMERHL